MRGLNSKWIQYLKELKSLNQPICKGIKDFIDLIETVFLVSYHYLLHNSYEAIFARQYDTSGNTINQSTEGAVRWYVQKNGSDSLDVVCYLFGLNTAYERVTFIANGLQKVVRSKKRDLVSNIFSCRITIKKNITSKQIYIRAVEVSTCTGQRKNFMDSVSLAFEQLK